MSTLRDRGSYKTISEFYGESPNPVQMKAHQCENYYNGHYKEHRGLVIENPTKETYIRPPVAVTQQPPLIERFDPSTSAPVPRVGDIEAGSLSDPKVWGPSFWFCLHNGAATYPNKASPIVSERMKGFILGIPYVLSCDECREHARVYIENHFTQLDEITGSREKLFCFFVDFHNQVNKRYGKRVYTCEEAKKLYYR